jgi:hypothetical protein
LSSYHLPAGAPMDDRFTAFLKSIKLFNVYSQNCEDAIIEAIFARIRTENEWCFECGAADGLFFSNTRRLIEQGWRAILVECDSADYRKLAELYAGNERAHCVQCWLVPDKRSEAECTLDEMLTAAAAPEDIDLLVLDVDSSEYYLVNSMVQYRPRVLIVEYDPLADPMFIPELRGKGQAGAMAMRYVCEARGYDVIGKTATNLICVRKDLSPLLMNEPSYEEDRIYKLDLKEGQPLQDVAFGVKYSRKFVTQQREDGEYICEGEHEIGKPCEFVKKEPALEGKIQVFAAGRWQDLNAPQIEATPEEIEASVFPQRLITVEEKRAPRIALCLSVPRIGFLDSFYSTVSLAQQAGMGVFIGWGVFWSHALSRSIKKALDWRDPKTGNGFDFILTADYDTFATLENVFELARLLGSNPDVDCVAPMQAKRGETLELLASFESANLTHELVPVKSAHFGFTLFRCESFQRLARPWFLEQPDKFGEWGEGRVDPDMYFWENAEKNGLKVALAPSVVVGHGEEVITWPVIRDGAFEKVYQANNEWMNTRKAPKGVGVVG